MHKTSLRQRLPFTGLDRAAWGRLGLLVIACLYAAIFAWNAIGNRMFDYFAADFRSYWATAAIARERGFADMYDLSVQYTYQLRLYQAAFGPDAIPNAVIPMPYLPPFALFFLPFQWLPPQLSFVAWTIVSVVVFTLYFQRLAHVASITASPTLISSLLLCAAVFFQLFFGQVSIGLLLCFGEAFIAFRRRSDFVGGLWLSGLLLKPQILLLIGPGLLLARKGQGLLGLGVGTLVLLGLSLSMVGVQGMSTMAQLLLGSGSANGISASAIEAMTNWRALAYNLRGWLPDELGQSVMWLLMALTAIVGLSFWRKLPQPDSPQFAIVWFGTYVATSLATWHNQFHAELPLIVTAFFIWKEPLTARPFLLWLYLPAIVYLGMIWLYTPLVILLGLNFWADTLFVHRVSSFSFIVVNCSLLGWAMRALKPCEGSVVISPKGDDGAPAQSGQGFRNHA
jgi:hypothetical protein